VVVAYDYEHIQCTRCFATRLNPKARKLVPKKKTNVKFVVRIQRWWRLIQSFLQDPFRRGNLKELMDTKVCVCAGREGMRE